MKLQDIERIIEQAYIEILREDDQPVPQDPVGDLKAGPETVLEDATDTMLEKFPTLKRTLIRLMTGDFKEFVDTVDWISPKPTTFRINLVNGQDFTLRWTGKDFIAKIQGKKHFLGQVDEFQQALDKLALLYQEAPLKGAGEEEEGLQAEPDFGGTGGGGDFPGGGLGSEAEPGFDDTAASPEGDEVGGADLGGEEIDFEAGEEPEA